MNISALANRGVFLVTGAAGFIGSNIIAALEKCDAKVVACDRLRDANKWRNLSKRELADIIEPEYLLDFLEKTKTKVACVIHMGAISSTVETNVDLIIENNFRLSTELWNWCTENNIPFIYASSAATYGDGSLGFDDGASTTSLSKLRPLNAYGWSKHLFDRWVARLVSDGMEKPSQWIGLKFFNVYGPNEYHKCGMRSVVAQVYDQVSSNKRARLFKSNHLDYKDGCQLRDFIWIDDVVDIVLWLINNQNVSGLFNCGSGKARTFIDLASAVHFALGKELDIEFISLPESIRDKYQYFTEANMKQLRNAGYHHSSTSLEEGVRKYVQEFLDTPDPYK